MSLLGCYWQTPLLYSTRTQSSDSDKETGNKFIFLDVFQSRSPESSCVMCLVLQKQKCLDISLLDLNQMQVTRETLLCPFRCLQGAGACGGL